MYKMFVCLFVFLYVGFFFLTFIIRSRYLAVHRSIGLSVHPVVCPSVHLLFIGSHQPHHNALYALTYRAFSFKHGISILHNTSYLPQTGVKSHLPPPPIVLLPDVAKNGSRSSNLSPIGSSAFIPFSYLCFNARTLGQGTSHQRINQSTDQSIDPHSFL